MRKIEPIYDFIEVDASNKFDLQQAAKEGFQQYGMRANHDERWVKLRRPLGEENAWRVLGAQ
jgi:hypothetical protein